MKAKCHNLMDTPKQIIANDNRYITTTYSVFPGIEFSFIDVHGHQIINEKKSKDDHTSGLDFRHMERTAELIASLKGKQTVLIVTHDPELIQRCCSHVLLINDGHASLQCFFERK